MAQLRPSGDVRAIWSAPTKRWSSSSEMDLESLRGRRITVVEVGPRDGLQNEGAEVSTGDKVEFVNRLSDAAEVFAQIVRKPGTRYSALVPNVVGLERAVQAGVREVAIFAASSETFSR